MKSAIFNLRQKLSGLYSQGEARAIINLLFEEICGMSRAQVMIYCDDLVLPQDQASLLASCADRLALGEPVQQVLGYEWFCNRKFKVTRDVLIPRPETAELVGWVVDNYVHNLVYKLPDNPVENVLAGRQDAAVGKSVENAVDKPVENAGITIVDIGTGSGCIALSLAADINNSHVIAVDLSTSALDVARQNAKDLSISNVEFVQADVLSDDFLKVFPSLSTVDIIVSNPPYICQKEKASMAVNVLDYEPGMALFVPDNDPLLFYRAIATWGLRLLKTGGYLYFEINEAYGSETCRLLESMGYKDVELRQDIDGRDRMICSRKQSLI